MMTKLNNDHQGDWSLSANGNTYTDIDKASERLTQRLLNSSSSVIGVAGQRGVGKSSLALNILDNCEKKGSFTQLIHAPTKYNPQEFLVSIFQTVCERVVEKVNNEFREADSLETRGQSELRRLNRNYRIIICLILLLPLALLVSIVIIGADEPDISQFLDLDIFPNSTGTLLLILSLVVVSLIYFPLILRVLPISHRIRFVRKSLKKTGLRASALNYSELLWFQATHSKSSEFGLSVSKVSSKSKTGKSLTVRPLSLPSLTTMFTQFISEIGEVYSGGPVVICLDELDKIEDPRDLDELLRGIKGILGVPNTHFLFTVSEDALAKFTSQRRMKRGILESAFDEIEHLRRINIESVNSIVQPMYGSSDISETDELEVTTSTELLWLFGNGVPREIKRNALVCLEEKRPPRTSSPKDVWKLLFRTRLNDMGYWTLQVGGDNDITYDFLRNLQESVGFLYDDSDDIYNLQWVKSLLTPWIRTMNKLIQETESSQIEFGKAIIDILLGASAFVYVVQNGQEERSVSSDEQQLRNIFQFTPINLQLGWDETIDYLSNIGMPVK